MTTIPIEIQIVLLALFFVWLILTLTWAAMQLEKAWKNRPESEVMTRLKRRHEKYLEWANSPYEKKGFWWSYPKWVDKITE